MKADEDGNPGPPPPSDDDDAMSSSSAAAAAASLRGGGGGAGTNKRKDRSDSATSTGSAAEVSTSDREGSNVPAPTMHASPPSSDDDAGSSRLFQPHRSLGLLTASSPSTTNMTHHVHSPSARLFRAHRGKFHLQPSAQSSDESFVTVPLGERFQILNVGKLNPVLVSRALPPSAAHHRSGKDKDEKRRGGSLGGDEEEMHRAVSDSSLSITVATHGPKSAGRAVSVTLYARTRPLVCVDAFPFLNNNKKKAKAKKNKWGIVDVVELGKRRVAMAGEKEGKMENALLLALVCARGDDVEEEGTEEKKGAKDGDGVEVVGGDSDEESEGEAAASEESSSDDSSSSGDDEDSASSVDDEDRAPAADCHGRILLVQATRTTLEIVKSIDLNGIGANFVPHAGVHPATYVNKILLGGRPARQNEEDRTSLLLVNVRSGKMIHSFKCLSNEGTEATPDGMTVTALAQSPAVDTLAVGTSDGSVHLINALHDVTLFTLRHKGSQTRGKNTPKLNSVSSMSFRTDGNAARQGVAPLAVGTADGSISVWDLTPVEDESTGIVRRTLLTQMEHAHHGGISTLAYLPGEPLLLSTGTSSNSIVVRVFDAPDHSGRILRQRKGHTSPPTLLRYLHPGIAGGGVLANASDGTDASSCQILSCGGPGDLSLRLFSTARSQLDKEYSQGPGLEKKARQLGLVGPEGRAELLLPQVTGLATSEARSREWGDLVTIHKNHAMAYVWSTKRGSQCGPVLRQPQWNVSAMKDRPPRSAHATSLAISACGNFALVGTVGGVVYKYNLQSGLPRGSFPRDASSLTDEEERRRKKGLKFAGDVGRTMRMLEKNASKGGTMSSDIDKEERDRVSYLEAEAKRKAMVDRAAHSDAVVGICIDSLNRTVVTAGADAKLVLWNFATHMPHRKSPIRLPSPASKLVHVRDSDLAAIAMHDCGVAVFDCASLAIVRYFGGGRCKGLMSHTGPISDLHFGPDGRKLFTSSLDGTIRVWDVPTGLCVDWMSFSSPPTSLALSPTGEFLATSHVGRLGISLWCDKSFFRLVLLDGTPKEPAKMNEPCPVAECEQEGASDAKAYATTTAAPATKDEFGDPGADDEANNDGSPPEAKESGLITLSGLPPAHWKNLFHLELVKERNKPTEAPQKPPQAPFFLQWRSGLESGTEGGPTDQAKGENNTSQPGAANEDGWDAVWSDDDADGKEEVDDPAVEGEGPAHEGRKKQNTPAKRRKVAHHRSKLAELLQDCFDAKGVAGETFTEVTSHLSTMGPSSIDVEISSLCYGIHDLDDGLPLLHLAAMWLLEACESHTSYEAVNAYLHRFLHVHGNVITRIDQALQDDTSSEDEPDEGQKLKIKEFVGTIARLREKQRDASNRLQGKMQHTICLLRHLSRMV